MSHEQQSLDLPNLLRQSFAHHQNGRLEEAERGYLQILKAAPNHFDTLHLLGIVQFQQGRNAEALTAFGASLKVKPDSFEALVHHGQALWRLGRHEEALASIDKALAVAPDQLEALNIRSQILLEMQRFGEAIASFDQVLTVKPDHAEALTSRGNALWALQRPGEALTSYDRALALNPADIHALNNRGAVLRNLKRPEEALSSYDRALAAKPDFVDALYNRGNLLQDLGRHEASLASYDRALQIEPKHVEALNARGNALRHLNRMADALASYDRGLAIKPDHVNVLANRGAALRDLMRFEDSLASYERALAIQPDNVNALVNRGVVLRDLKRLDDAVASYDRAIAIDPSHADALNNRGATFRDLKRLPEALASYEQALQVNPDHRYAFGGVADSAVKMCDWQRTPKLAGEIESHISEHRSVILPRIFLGYCNDEALHLQCAKSYIQDKIPVAPPPLWNGARRRHDKIRVAYLSEEYHRHATAYLTAELFEVHDRSRFEVYGISLGADDGSDIRARISKAFDHFYDGHTKSDYEVARYLSEQEIDIAVDIGSRLGPLSYRPAPIQVNYLVYPGTMGADFIDYLIVDKIVLPFSRQAYYTEKIVHLPECYQVNDSKREIAARTPTRHEVGLPEQGFVFCCFNNNWKITPDVFDIWMRLLRSIDRSVLWLLEDNSYAKENLRKEAAARGIDPARLIFAGRLPLEDHLARHRLADLFVDTIPCNAHTTASDALWAGLPVLTCVGDTFAGRVAPSLLHAIGLPELVTNDLQAYEALALKLATDPQLLQSIRQKLADHRLRYPLFDTDRFRVNIEAAYVKMWELWQAGEKPQSFSVQS